ncbi:MocR-like pyridoxine biosynthesis transcription factor PdxR [Thermoflavimicrobium dichotomicum]|uniref:GntR family transcriptional regulator, regulator for abcA and norABC n=1 Tax=Thermoflavimicrobium dichotomicum TaxID=46223 RepID=A0A1I3T8T8_9BACL|nr:PLP-dependent aminotransferase family protein [Thermoflavimicrobium dichotomicum]SFJ66993.1 GntR family transcriptional regulator, regulator for abcA and norABC [Thermoflavimicrobium dichotomicum]
MHHIDWRPSKRSTIPLYQQIVQYIKDKITCGEWPIGSQIPPQRELAKAFGVNRSTVITALEELMALGLIEGKTGKGTIVVNNTWSLLTATPPDWNVYVKSGFYKPNQSIVQRINLAENRSDLIHLGKGELSPQLFPLDKWKMVTNLFIQEMDSLGYGEPKGLLVLRQAIHEHLKTLGIHVSPASILIVSGALQALQLISVGLLSKGSTILLEEPSYLFSLQLFQSAGMILSGLPMDQHGLTLKSLSIHGKQRKRNILYVNPSFHNPTGTVMSEDRRKEILGICEKEQLPIIEDNVYGELWIDARPPLPLKARDKHGQVLYLGSLSKTLSPGLRIGWIVGPEPVVDRLADIKMQTDYGTSAISQWIAAEWFKSGLYHEHVESVRSQLKIRRQVAVEALEQHLKGLASWNIPSGGFFIWVKILVQVPMKKVFDQALSQGVLFYPGSIYHPKYNQYLRLSYSYASLAEIRKGIYIIARIIKQCLKQI